jgi:uncharacterized repeat protein (TIGR03803 family)
MRHVLCAGLLSIAMGMAHAQVIDDETFAPMGDLQILHTFADLTSEGGVPEGGVTLDTRGQQYGTTFFGGQFGLGTIFRMNGAGQEVVLHSFNEATADGESPTSQMAMAPDGWLYGSTNVGGVHLGGVVYRISTRGKFELVHSFVRSLEDGSEAWGPSGVIVSKSGQLWGVTQFGGYDGGQGTVFKIGKRGQLETIHKFAIDGSEGWRPVAPLVQGVDGYMYGTTSAGAGDSPNGTIFRVNGNGKFEILHKFASTEGSGSMFPLVESADGVFIGVQSTGGTSGRGLIYRVDASGAFQILHSFGKRNVDASTPFSGLALGADGNFYGVTRDGGPNGGGTIYQMTLGGQVAIVFGFQKPLFRDNKSMCAAPRADRLAVGLDGGLYGQCTSGGIQTDVPNPRFMGATFKFYPAQGR